MIQNNFPDQTTLLKMAHEISWYHLELLNVDASGALMRIFWDNKVNIFADDALAPCVTRPSAVMVLIMWDKQMFVFHKEEFKLSISS